MTSTTTNNQQIQFPDHIARIARIAIICSGPTSLEQAHETAVVLEEIARRLRIDCHLGQEEKTIIIEDGRRIGSIRFEAEDAVTA
jgi:hypothetical protein